MVMLVVRDTSRTVAIAAALLCLLSGFNCLNGVLAASKVDDSKGPVFLKEPTNRIDFSNSTGAVVECSATGNPPPEMIWIRSDGTAVGDVPGLRQILPNGNLVFPPFRAEDYRQEVHAQVYACMAKNQFGSVISRDVNVRAVVQQYYDSEVNNAYVIRGNSAILKCSIPSFVADFVGVVSWNDDAGNVYQHIDNRSQSSDVQDLEIDGKYMVLPSGELHIREVGPEDGYKSYQCRTKHRLTGETRLSATKGRLVITEPLGRVSPKLDSTSKIVTAEVGRSNTIALLCSAQGYPIAVFRWYKYIEGTQQKKAVVLDERVKQVSGTLIIKDAVVDDSGKYLCVVNNSVGGESVETVLTVTAPLAAKIEPRTQTVDFGRPAVFTCKFSGNPIKTVSWMKDGKSLGHSDAVLRIESVKKEDKGMYQCFIRNDQESAQASAELKLGGRFDPPIIREAFPEETRHPGPSVFLKCVAGGNPTPEISWELDGKKITNSERYQVGQYVTVNGDVVSHLNITSIHSNDGGLYKCMASSKVGVAEHSAKLNVYGLPYVRTMEKKAIVAGETLIVTCPVAGYPIESIVWERDNRQLPINRKQKVFPNGTLIIENVERNSDQATYTCVAKNSEGYTARGTLEVQVMVPPKILPFSFGTDPMNYGESASIQCSVISGDFPMTIDWLYDGHAISTIDSLHGITAMAVGKRAKALSIEGITGSHAGNYTCLVTNDAGVAEHTEQLIVNVPPRWILEPTDKAFAQGSNAKVECKADGFPKPQVTWKKAVGDTPGEYKDLRSNDSSIRVEEGSLFIQNIQKSNEGYYLCEAINGIGSGLSAVTLITVQAPPEFVEKLRNQTARRGEPSVLQCEAKGEKPIGILWNMNNIRLDPKSDNRYTIREEILTNGVTSSLSIKRTERSDSALFTCMATNAFGSDDTSINMIIQEPPEMPYALKVLDKSGRTVQLSWAKPYDGNSPLKRYIIEFKRSRGSWENDIDRVIVPGDTNEAQVQKLSPATTYNIRIVAENEIGVSDPSDVVTIITAEEAPSGKPQAIKVEAINQSTLRVSWKAPPRAEWNGDILGYYVGYKQTSVNTLYVYETVNYSPEGGEGKEHSLEINNLKTYTQYSIVIQAFNKVGAGPMSDEEKQYTAEGTPDQPPSDTMCTTLTSQTIRVSWVSPPLESANGVIKGYKVVYAPSDLWNNDKNKDYKKTASSDTVLHGLKKYTNYTMQVLATTSGGDGVRSAPIHCQTEQDVPEAPTAVKALVMSEGSILVSWQPPAQPNGLILQYTVYIKSGDQEPKSFKVPSFQINYEASGLEKNQKYEFWVTASTTIGEGQSSKTLSAMPSDKVPAKIASFDDKFTATFKEDAKLPCLAVGSPTPDITWKIKGVEFVPNERIRQLPEGSLFIKDVIRQDAGDYTCTAENSIAKDSITHRLIVLAPPQSPQLTLTATTTDSLSVKLKPHESDTAPLQGYTLHYKPEFGEWETIDVALEAPKYTIEKLYCGSRYQVYATAYNTIGAGEPSDILNTRTKGSKPLLPEKSRFIEVSSNSITLHLPAWKDGGCRMSHFVVEHKKKDQIDWNQISNNVKPGGNFVVLDLEPATWYNLRVTAHNNAGFTVAEYEFATLTMTGGTVAPSFGSVQPGTIYPPWIPHWIDLNVMVPLIATVIVVAVGVLVICVAISRRRDDDPRCGPKDVYYDVVYNQSMGPAGAATLDKRRPDIRDELGYIAPPNRKLPPVPGSNYNTCDRVKRGTVISHNPSIKSNHTTWDPRRPLYEELKKAPPPLPRRFNHPPACYGMEDEICPYATFHLLGFREEMDPTKAMNFQTFPHQNGMGGPGHMGTMGSSMAMQVPSHVHSRSGSQSMPRQNRYAPKNSQGGQSSIYTPAPEYDDPANCAEEDQYRRYTRINSQGGSLYCGPGPEYDDPANCAPEDDQYGSQYGGNYGTPYEHYGSRGSVGRRSVGSPEPPPPPPRNHDTSNSSFNDSKESNEISEAECDRDNGPRGNYGEPSEASSKSNDAINGDETEKLLKRNEVKPKYTKQAAASGNTGLTAYDTMAV
ncbi:cell adhesion molecule Dscam2 isoform X12 [Anopheles maculipalpis]|uniref:cell adhesion molecule Dscam2 isoform X12 n=1 Tax=Anopheles maculipalpis TaxID=1496333 RepID=UPI0021596980|nr:cell adhesion molecule Dscam2 isoform X12 [Anopheles maculipalpis]